MSATPPAVSRGAAWAFGRYLDRLARKTFTTVWWRSLDDWSAWPTGVPTLVVANHTNWWDGFLSHQVTRAMGRPFRILMETEHLMRYRGFLRVGALPIERRNARQAMRDLAVAARCLAGDTMVWIYPQGMRRPAVEPLRRLEHGAAWLIGQHAGPLRVLPVAFRYGFTSEQRPEGFVLLGEPWLVPPDRAAPRAATTDRLAAMLLETLSVLDADVAVERFEDYRPLITGPMSINNRLDRVRHALGLLPDYRVRNG